ncbi:bacterial leucyl aminopeptidase precursor [bacterium BMS3Abin03]|nr:bacterial leucyl aminopeptidase precursor [bacterium BMS3Abin03]
MKRFFIILTLPLLLISTSTAQPLTDSIKIKQYKKVAQQFVSSALKERKGYDALKNLCRIGPRLSGSRNSLIAINWAKNKLIEMGSDSVWLQPVMVTHWERGDIEQAGIINSKKFNGIRLHISALGGSIGTPPEGIAGRIIEVQNFEELKEKKDSVKGKIVFFNRPLDQSLLNTFRGYGEAVDQRVYGAIEAAKYGAIGVIIRSITTKYDTVPHTGVMHYVDSLPKIPSVAAGYLDANFLSRIIKEDPNLKLNMLLNCKTLPDAKSFNVIGEIKGSGHPEEVIVVGGHIDSWDVGQGAHDDGAGCIQSIEVLDLFKRLHIKPKRTIRCVLFINEENGSRGSKEYSNFAENSGEINLAAVESDRGGFTPKGFNIRTDSSRIIEKVKSWLPILEKAGIDWIRKGGSGADVGRIKNARALFSYVPDNQRYFDLHHSANDVFETIHPRELELGSAAIAILVYLLSEEGL